MSPSKIYRTTLSVILLIAFASGCTQDKEAIVQQKVSERVADFRVKKAGECRETLLATAEKIVDSLLLTEAQRSLEDSLMRARPGRPFQPPAIPPIDSLNVKPLFEGGAPDSPGRKGG